MQKLRSDEVMEFVGHRMRMSHVYQPLMIRALVEAGGSASIRQLANQFLAKDDGQIRYYERIIRRYPVPVLKRHRIVTMNDGTVSLNIQDLDDQSRTQLKDICDQKIGEFMTARGNGIFRLSGSPVSSTTRLRILEDSGGRCALCGVTNKEMAMDVDHIKPRSRGGSNERSNLQALCTRCNRSKRDRSEINYAELFLAQKNGCYYCSGEVRDSAVGKIGTVFATAGSTGKGDITVAPFHHANGYLRMSEAEHKDTAKLIRQLAIDRTELASGFSVSAVVNPGEPATSHAVIRLIPED